MCLKRRDTAVSLPWILSAEAHFYGLFAIVVIGYMTQKTHITESQ